MCVTRRIHTGEFLACNGLPLTYLAIQSPGVA